MAISPYPVYHDDDAAIGIEIRPFNWPLRRARMAAGMSRRQLALSIGVSPTAIGAAEALKKPLNETNKIKVAIALNRGVTELFPEELDELTLERQVVEVPLTPQMNDRFLDPGDDIEREERIAGLHDAVRSAMADLNPREQDVLRMRFGFDGGQQHTLGEIANSIGVSRGRAQQIEQVALRKLRYPKRSRRLRPYVEAALDPPAPPATIVDIQPSRTVRSAPVHQEGSRLTDSDRASIAQAIARARALIDRMTDDLASIEA